MIFSVPPISRIFIWWCNLCGFGGLFLTDQVSSFNSEIHLCYKILCHIWAHGPVRSIVLWWLRGLAGKKRWTHNSVVFLTVTLDVELSKRPELIHGAGVLFPQGIVPTVLIKLSLSSKLFQVEIMFMLSLKDNRAEWSKGRSLKPARARVWLPALMSVVRHWACSLNSLCLTFLICKIRHNRQTTSWGLGCCED